MHPFAYFTRRFERMAAGPGICRVPAILGFWPGGEHCYRPQHEYGPFTIVRASSVRCLSCDYTTRPSIMHNTSLRYWDMSVSETYLFSSAVIGHTAHLYAAFVKTSAIQRLFRLL
jgi:hypothetical protein